MRKCSNCEKILSEGNYYKCRKSQSGYQSWCKECKRISVRNAPSYKLPSRTKEQGRNRYYDNRVMFNFSRRLRLSLRGGKVSSWTELVDFSLDDLRRHLERQFTNIMTWNNYGKVWHIDHIRPISSFDISSEDCPDFKKCWSLSNLQPLLARDNILKSNKF